MLRGAMQMDQQITAERLEESGEMDHYIKIGRCWNACEAWNREQETKVRCFLLECWGKDFLKEGILHVSMKIIGSALSKVLEMYNKRYKNVTVISMDLSNKALWFLSTYDLFLQDLSMRNPS